MEARRGRIRTLAIAMAMATLLSVNWGTVRAQVNESDVPETSVVPSEESAPPRAAPRQVSAAAGHQAGSPAKPEVEPAHAVVKLNNDTAVLAQPDKTSKQIEQAQAGKFIDVTGSTHYFLQVKLKSGETGYIDPAAVELVKPTDKIFTLTSDSAVLEKPNKWSKKLSAVHKGHNVHVIGIALDYTKIRMKSGLEGYVPMSALE
ncbi:MAG: hypothetical protein JO121_07755 [Deltaproteobacteria bacterium]|jgi:uncharacterized protein YgiM (DUF1202 family)|nr:hypothetical protein [Deltaproteobacteria bacterium]